MEISVVITNWNGEGILKETLPTVIDAAIKDPDNYYEILLVDDMSTDNSVEFVRRHFPEVKIISTPENKGYMHANNYGVSKAKFPLVFCLNNDMKIAPSTIPVLLKYFQDPETFAVSGKILDWDNNFLYGNRGGFFKDGHFSYFEKDMEDMKTQSLFACGGAFLCRKDMYLELGGYDAELFSPYYYDETDLCFRALKKGYRVIYDKDSVAWHKVSQTANKQYENSAIKVISARNNYLFTIKNIHDSEWTKDMKKYIPLFLIRDLFKGKFRFWKAFFQVLDKWQLVQKKREQEKKLHTVISEREIFRLVKGENS